MRFIEAPQGSAEWLAARCGRITASRFADAISLCSRKSGKRVVGDPTAEAERYAGDIAIERISGKPHGEPPKAWVLERGHEMEFAARMKYEARTRAYVTESGICVDESEWFGYSSDGLVNSDGLIEIKAPIDSSKIMAMWATGDVSEYIHQIQGGLWLTGRSYCDFLMYVPDLAPVGKDLFSKRIYRDDEFIDAMVGQLRTFQQMVQRYEAILRGDHAVPPAETVASFVPPPWDEPPAAPAASDWRTKFLQQAAP
jgi:exodeoxyribonuclease (lambda-induced)